MSKNDLLDQAKKRTESAQHRYRNKDSAWDDLEHLVRLREKDREEHPDDYDPEEDGDPEP